MSEHTTQKAFFEWAQVMQGKIPELDLLYAVPNGGQRHPAVAKKLKAEGVKAGIPDVQWAIARGGFVGLAIEFKDGANNPTKDQRERMTRLQQEGWCVCVCWDWQAAARTVQGYAGMAKVGFVC